ncbi:hypothetical protein Tco_0671345 [Tanacetum coccineum]
MCPNPRPTAPNPTSKVHPTPAHLIPQSPNLSKNHTDDAFKPYPHPYAKPTLSSPIKLPPLTDSPNPESIPLHLIMHPDRPRKSETGSLKFKAQELMADPIHNTSNNYKLPQKSRDGRLPLRAIK